MSKRLFVKRCIENGITLENAEKAWTKLRALQKYIKKHWDAMKDMQTWDAKHRLQLRQFAAEQGFEYTPDELNELISVIGLIQAKME